VQCWLLLIFCRFLTFGQSPSRVALKIRCRSRRTCSSQDRQLMVSHSSTSCSRRWSSGPFTPRRAIATANACAVMSNLSFGSGGLDCSSSKGSPATRQPAFAARHQAWYPASYARRPAEGPVIEPRFPVSFRPPAFASWASCPARGFRPPYGRPTAPPPATRTRTGFPRSARARPGWDRASSVPRGRRCRRDRRVVPGRRCRFATARPCHPSAALRPGMCLSRGINKDSLHSPVQPSPHL